MNRPDVRVFESKEALCEAAADQVVELIQKLPEGERFSLALSGGSTPQPLHHALATKHRDALDWSRIHVFWGDDRFVPADDENSNYRMARETLLDHAPIPKENVYPIPTDVASPEEAAHRYEQTLKEFFGTNGPPQFDLMLLGMGPDGHTASLFPGVPALREEKRWAAGVEAPQHIGPHVPRITLTLPVINNSKRIFFLVAGENKQEPLAAILNGEPGAGAYPSSRVHARQALVWFLDQAVAEAADV